MTPAETQWERYSPSAKRWAPIEANALRALLFTAGHDAGRLLLLGAEVYYSSALWFRPVRAERLDST